LRLETHEGRRELVFLRAHLSEDADDLAGVILRATACSAALRELNFAVERVAVGRAVLRVDLVARVAEADLRAADFDLPAKDARALAVLLEEPFVLVDLLIEALD